VFDGRNMLETLRLHVEATPQPPSRRLGKPLSPDLEQLILQCLAKSPADRPASANALDEALGRCNPLQSWTVADAARWWNEFEAAKAAECSPETPTAPHVTSTVHSDGSERVTVEPPA
jgi:hypothetical protein